jgi:acyl transferase domain-containing protein
MSDWNHGEGTGGAAGGIAVVGMSGRFPGARTPEQLWANLRAGVESITFFAPDGMELPEEHRGAAADPRYVRASGVLEDVEWFDAEFFGFTAREAEITDPQQRLFLECAWEALESAGCDPARFDGRIGVYGGGSASTYHQHNLLPNHALRESLGPLHIALGNERDYLTTVVSYKLNLKGPSATVLTTCSTSLVATHFACQALLAYQCDLALAGGVSVRVPHRVGYRHQPGGIFSPDGHCRAFDARAQGTVAGSGAGVVALKRLADALADGDEIHAVILGTAVNNDGAAKVGFTAPSVEGQAEVIAEAQAMAGVEADTISYVETHGTGTALGDPIEVAALAEVFGGGGLPGGRCALGSVKTNLGHLDAAAGVAGLIKTVLALKHAEIPPSLHFETPNPELRIGDTPFFVNAALTPWRTGGGPRRAGVSSFGIGGTNAHVVVEEAPPAPPSGPSRPWQLLVLSARTPSALEAATERLADHLRRHPELPLADVAHTLQVGRSGFDHRRAVSCRGTAEAAAALASRDPDRVRTAAAPALPGRPVAFLFPGQGAQYPGMARGAYAAEPAFRAEVDRCAEMLRPHLGLDLRTVLFPPEAHADAAAERLDRTELAQPSLFVVEYALAKLWMSWGVRPDSMIGHSVGEYVAACLAGVFPLEQALALVSARGRLMQALPPGAMLAVPLPEAEVVPLLGGGMSLAAVNAPDACVVSGPREAAAALEERLARAGHPVRRLRTSHAFHSAMMDPALEEFAELVRGAAPRPPEVPFVSNLTGEWITPGQATDPRYWAAHLRHTVRFAAGVDLLCAEPDRAMLEVGPGGALGSLARRSPAAGDERVVVRTLSRDGEDSVDGAQAGALARLWLAGVDIDWAGFSAGERRRRVPLPTYPFERRHYWVDAPGASVRSAAREAAPRAPAAPDASPAPAPAPAGPAAGYEDDIQETLAGIWRELLGCRPPRPHDDLFELGANSLVALQLLARLHKIYPVELSVRDVFDRPTLLGQAELIEELLLAKVAGMSDEDAERLL